MKLKRTFLMSWLVWPAFLISLIFPPLSSQAASTVIRHDGDVEISSDTVWRTGEVHIIADDYSLTIDAGATLTLEPGVIVKLGKNSAILPLGSLYGSGTASNPIIFTSSRDDASGGDTNGDGAATTPAPGDWYAIMTPPPSVANIVLNFVKIQYGGRVNDGDFVSLYINAAQSFSISSSSIINNAGYIMFGPQAPAGSKIVNSNIYNPDFPSSAPDGSQYFGTAIMNQGAAAINLTGNYFGHSAGPTISGDEYLGTLVGGAAAYMPFSNKPLDLFKPEEAAKLHPVILIPGILGSALVPTGNKLANGKTEYAWALDPILRTYDNLWQALKNAGYTAGTSLFAFPYDWRKSNIETAKLLNDKIVQVKNSCLSSANMDCTKVDLIGHSMGGLVARQYIEDDSYNHDVDQVIFLATPHQGAPKAYMMWEAGEFGLDIKSQLMKKYLELEAAEHLYIGNNGLFRYIHDYNIESVKELLPTFDYLVDKGSNTSRAYPNNYPINPFLDQLNSADKLAKLNGVTAINIVADDKKSDTVIGFKVVSSTDGEIWQYGMPFNYYGWWGDKGVEYGGGDSTVPARSNHDFVGENIVVLSSHENIPTDAQSAVIKALVGKAPSSEVRDWLIKNFIMIRIFSPADFQIVAPDGKVMGRDFATDQAINEIGGYYSGFDNDAEWAVIPNPQDGQYQINLKGTDNGKYRLSVSGISDATSTDYEVLGMILAGDQRNITLEVDSAQAALIEQLTPKNITLDDMLDELNSGYKNGLIHDEKTKNLVISDFKRVMFKYELASKAITILERVKAELISNTRLNEKAKQKVLAANDKLIIKARAEVKKMIESELESFTKLIKKFVQRGKIDSLLYDIISEDAQVIINNL